MLHVHRYSPWLLITACLLPVLSGCPQANETRRSGSEKRIVILTNGDDPFWDACEAGAFKAHEEFNLKEQGYTLSFDRADFTDKGQVDKIKQHASKPGLVAFGISVYTPDSPAVARELREMQKRGIKVVTIDGDIDRTRFRDARYAYLGTDNIVAGRELGKAARTLRPDGGKFAFFVGNAGAANAIQRMAGFREGAGSTFVETELLEDRGDRAVARKNVQDALDRHPDLMSLVGIWAYNTPQTVSVVKDRNLKSKTIVCAFDAAESSISGMRDGNVDVMVVQNPYQMGYVGVQLLKALHEDDQEFVKGMYPDYKQEGTGDMFETELRVIVPNEGSPIKKEVLEPKSDFMNLNEFEGWLKERNLSSS